VALALPWLESLAPRNAEAARGSAPRPRRLSYVYIPMGVDLPRWTPPPGRLPAKLPPILEPLAPFARHLTVVSNHELKNAYSAGNHATANSAFLSAARAKMTEGSDYELGTTIDQLIARQVGRDTPLPSLELGMDLTTAVGNCDNGFACVYQNNLSWSSPTSPLPTEAHPRVVFERLFGTGGTPAQRRAELRKDASILDSVRTDLAGLEGRVGSADRPRVAEYLETVREVERRIQGAERRVRGGARGPARDRQMGVPEAYADHARLMFDLQVLALAGDLTRVMTFQLARETSNRTYPEIGVAEAHHPLTHHANDPVKVEKMSRINTFHVSLFSYYLRRLGATRDGDGSLLDHTLILCGSGMGNPDVHDHANLPIVVAGGGAGVHRGGRHVRYDRPTPLANLHLTMADAMGVRLDSFGDGKGRLPEILS
jgi:hypothetical protein